MAYGLLPSRIWQFLCGTLAFELEQKNYSLQSDYKRLAKCQPMPLLMFSNAKITTNPSSWCCYMFMRDMMIGSLVIFVIINPSMLNETTMRVTGTLLTTCYISTSNFTGDSFLSLRPLVYVGDISYTLYLVHWPTIVFYKYYYGIADLGFGDLCWCLVFMFLFSVVIYHTVEKSLVSLTISNGILLVLSCMLCILLTAPSYKKDVQISFIAQEQRNKTAIIQRAIEWNTKIAWTRQAVEVDLDNPNRTYTWLPCKRDFEADRLSGWAEEPNTRCIDHGNGTLNVLVMGNSISYRAFPRIQKIFNGRYRTLRLFSRGIIPGFYASARSPVSLRFEAALKKLVENSKPDVIFIMYAALGEESQELQRPIANIKIDKTLKHLQKNFDFYSKYTRKIVIDLPYYTTNEYFYSLDIARRLKLGKRLDHFKITRKDLEKQQHWQHERLMNLNCSKCVLNDVNEALFNGDTFYFYDRTTFYSYYQDGIHLTYAGLDLLMPLYSNVIEKLMRN